MPHIVQGLRKKYQF